MIPYPQTLGHHLGLERADYTAIPPSIMKMRPYNDGDKEKLALLSHPSLSPPHLLFACSTLIASITKAAPKTFNGHRDYWTWESNGANAKSLVSWDAFLLAGVRNYSADHPSVGTEKRNKRVSIVP